MAEEGRIFTGEEYTREVLLPLYKSMLVMVSPTPVPIPEHGGDIDLGSDTLTGELEESVQENG